MALATASTVITAERPVRLQVGREKPGEGNPDDPGQARSQMSEHVKVVGLLLVLREHVPTHMRSQTAPRVITRRNVAGTLVVPDGLRATETAFAYLCLQIWATVDTTIYPSINNHNRYAIGSPDGRELERGEAVEILLRQRETKIGADTRSISCYATRMERRDGLR